MTKRLIAAVILLVAAFLLSFLAVKRVEAEISYLLYEIENTQDVFLCAGNVLDRREKNERVFSMLLKHTDADMIDKLHISLAFALEERDEYRIKTLLSDIYSYLYVTLQGEKVKSENIF